MPGYKRCRSTFFSSLNGRSVAVQAGDIVCADDPVVQLAEDHFEDIDNFVKCFGHSRSPVSSVQAIEQATSAPGEKRVTSRGRPRKEKPVVDDKSTGDEKEESKDA